MDKSKLDISSKELAELVRNWLRLNGRKYNVWNRNIVGKTIKEELLRLDHWKSARRGDGRKAYRAMINSQK